MEPKRLKARSKARYDRARLSRATCAQSLLPASPQADGGRSDQERSDDDDDGGASRRRRHTSPSVQRLQLQPWDELAHRGTRVLARSSSSTHAPSSAHATAHASSSSAAAAAAAAAASSGLPASSVLTLSLRQHVSALGWDPRRPGRLALVDRASPHVLLLDLGASRQVGRRRGGWGGRREEREEGGEGMQG